MVKVSSEEEKFNETFITIKDILNKMNIDIKSDNYDGIIVKKLAATNTINSTPNSHQSHIAITSNQRDIFPYLQSDGYFNENSVESLKKYFTLQIPINLSSNNILYLNNEITTKNDNKELCHVSVVRRKITNQNEQIQLHIRSNDSAEFYSFRELLEKDDYLIILKLKEEFKYEAYGIKSEYDAELSDFNNRFYHKKTETVIKTDIFDSKEDQVELEHGENILLYGVPGSGKSRTIEEKYCNDEEFMERVVFHPDYTYSDFIGQILPKVSENVVSYEFSPGPFTNILKKANEEQNQNFFLIIEEINRGNAPAIFGDVFQLLDRKTEKSGDDIYSDVGSSEYAITNQDIAKTVYNDSEHKVRIPSNLFIIGTMNTSDQNVFTLDTAFQRRWNMRLIKNSFENVDENLKNEEILDTHVTWEKFCTVINDIILEKNRDSLSSEDKRIGPYFVNSNDLRYSTRFSEKILKYLWDDAFKFSRDEIFDDRINCLESLIIEFVNAELDAKFYIFKENIYHALCGDFNDSDGE